MQNQQNRHLPLVYGAVLALVTLALYWPAHRYEFINYDDPVYVVQNVHVQAGLTWKSFCWAWTTAHASNWHPLTWISHMADVEFFGTAAGSHHLTSVFLHIANSLLVFWVFLRMTGSIHSSALVAALFAWHPLHVESVAWISERKDLLSGLFFLLTLWAYTTYAKRTMGPSDNTTKGNSKRTSLPYCLALGFFALGLLSKPMLVTLPFVLLLLDVWPFGRVSLREFRASEWKPLLLEKVPFFLLAAASSVVTFQVQSQSGAVASLSYIPLEQRFTNALTAYLVYLQKTIWPTDLAVFYPYPEAALWTTALISAVVIAIATSAAVRQVRSRPWLAVGWFFYLGTLVPVIGLVQVGNQAFADRYAYLPLVGIFLAVAWSVRELASTPGPKRILTVVVSGTLLAVCCLAARSQLEHWENSETLFRRALAVTSKNYLAHHNLAYYLAGSGRPDEAREQYEQALAVQPDYYEAHLNLGMLLLSQSLLQEASTHLLRASEINPDSAEAHYNYGVALGRQGKDQEAIREFQKATDLDPDHLNAHFNLGMALANTGRLREAEAHYREAIRLGQKWAGVADARLALPHQNLGLLLREQGREKEAQEHLERAARLRARLPEGRN